MLDFEQFEVKEDFSKMRSTVLPNGINVVLQRTDPYGLVKITFKEGRTPEIFGLYTSFAEAEKELTAYANTLDKKKSA